jgi:hypothetical protein
MTHPPCLDGIHGREQSFGFDGTGLERTDDLSSPPSPGFGHGDVEQLRADAEATTLGHHGDLDPP